MNIIIVLLALIGLYFSQILYKSKDRLVINSNFFQGNIIFRKRIKLNGIKKKKKICGKQSKFNLIW
jgi:hypothetical protein